MGKPRISEFKGIIQEYGLEYFGIYLSKYRGFVLNNEDEKTRGRLQVYIPAIHGKNKTSKKWCLPSGMMAGIGNGWYWLPQKDDPVWIEFEGGNPEFPIWSYGWYKDGASPEGSGPKKMVFQSVEGSRLEFDDDEKKVLLKRKDGQEIEITDSKINIGTAGGASEPVVLGDKNAGVHSDHLTELNNVCIHLLTFCTTQTSAAGSLPLLAPLIPGYSALAASIAIVQGMIASIQGQVPMTKSSKVNTD